MRVVRVNGRRVAPDEAALSVDDPLARAGDGLIETMRARNGVVFRLDRHLARLAESARDLDMPGLPAEAEIRREIGEAVAAAGRGDLRVRVAVSAAPTLWVEADAVEPLGMEPATATAITMPGSWRPDLFTAQHKTASRAMWSWADRKAREARVDAALLLDDDGRMGESTTASVFVRTSDGEVLTAPARGLLPGVGREVMMSLIPGIRERAAEREEWTTAQEVVLVSALRGVVAVTSIDGRPVGDGRPGPMARGQQSALKLILEQETAAG